MSEKLKLRVNTIVKITTALIIIVFTIFFIADKNSFKVNMKDKKMNIGEEYINNFIATFKGENVTDKVEVTNNIYNTKIGEYKVTFTYKRNNREYRVVKSIIIEDNEKPQINLINGSEITIKLNEEFIEPGYIATDNYDGDITNKVKIEGNVDVAKEGTYVLTYTVTDSQKNKTIVERKIIVSKRTN